MIPEVISNDIVSRMLPTIISSTLTLFYLISALVGLPKKHRMRKWWVALMIFLALQQINFIFCYYTDFGYKGDTFCCQSLGAKIYVTFVQTLCGRHSIYYLGYFFSRASVEHMQTKYKKKKDANLKANICTVSMLLFSLSYIAVKAYSDRMKKVESFIGRLMPSPESLLFYSDVGMLSIALILIIKHFRSLKKRGFAVSLNKKNFMSQQLVKEYYDNYYLPKKCVKFLITYLILDQLDSVLTFIVHFFLLEFEDYDNPNRYYIDTVRWLFLYVFLVYPSVFVSSVIFQKGKDEMELGKLRVMESSRKQSNLVPESLNGSDETNFMAKNENEPETRFTYTYEVARVSELPRKTLLMGLSQKKRVVNPEIASVIVSFLTLHSEMREAKLKKINFEDSYTLGNTFLALRQQNQAEFGKPITTRQIEHKRIYSTVTDWVYLLDIIEESWGKYQERTEELDLFSGKVISYFQGIVPKTIFSLVELEDLISHVYKYLYQDDASLLVIDMAAIRLGNIDVQILSKSTKVYLLKKVLQNYFAFTLEPNRHTHLLNIRQMCSLASENQFYCSFLVMESNIKEAPIFCY